jgi:hypothetical protein
MNTAENQQDWQSDTALLQTEAPFGSKISKNTSNQQGETENYNSLGNKIHILYL